MYVLTTLKGKVTWQTRVFFNTVDSHLRIIRDKLVTLAFRGKPVLRSQYSDHTTGS